MVPEIGFELMAYRQHQVCQSNSCDDKAQPHIANAEVLPRRPYRTQRKTRALLMWPRHSVMGVPKV